MNGCWPCAKHCSSAKNVTSPASLVHSTTSATTQDVSSFLPPATSNGKLSVEISWRDWISPLIHLLPELEGQTLAKCGRISIWYGKNHPKRNNSQTPRAWVLAVWCVIPTPVATLGRVFGKPPPLVACSFFPVPRPMGASGRSPFGMGRVLAWQSSTIPRYVWGFLWKEYNQRLATHTEKLSNTMFFGWETFATHGCSFILIGSHRRTSN